MKIIGTLILALTAFLGGLWIWNGIYASYQWQNEVLSNWSLSDKSSTLEAKSLYIDKFVLALQSAHLSDNDALIYKTADNSCQNNINAVITLRDRLNQIKGMDESSFQYQQAITQITAQEQGEADKLLGNLEGCWMKTNHYYLWHPIFGILGFVGLMLMAVLGVVLLVIQQ